MDRWSNKSFTNSRKSQTRDGARKQNKGYKDKSKRKMMMWFKEKQTAEDETHHIIVGLQPPYLRVFTAVIL